MSLKEELQAKVKEAKETKTPEATNQFYDFVKASLGQAAALGWTSETVNLMTWSGGAPLLVDRDEVLKRLGKDKIDDAEWTAEDTLVVKW